MSNILIFAGAWGWGPVTTAEMVCNEIHTDTNIKSMLSGIALQYARINPKPFGTVHSLDTIDKYTYPCDVILSVVEPIGPLIAKITGKPLIAIDNLFWHWQWQNIDINRISAIVNECQDFHSICNTIRKLQSLGSYAEYASMYCMSDHIYWQKVAAVPQSIPNWMRKNSTLIPPLLGKLPAIEHTSQRKNLTISLSGGLVNPYTTADQLETYSRLLSYILADTLSSYENIFNIVFAAPKTLHRYLYKYFPNYRIGDFSRSSFLQLLSQSAVVLAPAGLSTTFEAAALGTPLVILPEQHDGNYSNYIGLAGIAHTAISHLNETFPAITLAAFGFPQATDSADKIFSIYKENIKTKNSSFALWGKHTIQQILSDVISHRDEYVRKQQEILDMNYRQISGESIIKEAIMHTLEKSIK